ncbi:MAG: hypothetical protein H6Q79_2737 [Deltaproteobacteria bacterium]|nr:hypothetical protein [Deltaproteobacteria bacterium]
MSRRNIARFLVLLGFVPFTGFIPFFQSRIQNALEVRQACAQEGWREEFDTVCAKTDIAMTLSRDELTDLIGRCDRLKARIEAEEESTRKVYLQRLRMCQDLYRFVLQSKPPGR